jgi:hypothetical protein
VTSLPNYFVSVKKEESIGEIKNKQANKQNPPGKYCMLINLAKPGLYIGNISDRSQIMILKTECIFVGKVKVPDYQSLGSTFHTSFINIQCS